MKMGWRLLTLGLLILPALTPSYISAQDKPDQPTPKIAQATDASQNPTPGGESTDKTDHTKDEVPKRIFFIIPNFMTTNEKPEDNGPLTTKGKFTIAWHQFFDESAHFGNVIQAALSQAANGIPHYGQGWGAFGERFLAQEGDQFTGSMLIYGVLPTVLHQDPRYFRKGRGSPASRIWYAATRVVITRTDSGNPTFNASQVFGQLGQAAISLSYYPQQDRDVHGLFVGWAINQAYNIGWNQLKEFTPDLGAFLKRHPMKKKKPPTPAGTSAYSPSNRLILGLDSDVDAILAPPAGLQRSPLASGR
jgi:hypothetical protein